jgi:hypothetical protein
MTNQNALELLSQEQGQPIPVTEEKELTDSNMQASETATIKPTDQVVKKLNLEDLDW